jgi:hypothetical protein
MQTETFIRSIAELTTGLTDQDRASIHGVVVEMTRMLKRRREERGVVETLPPGRPELPTLTEVG